MQDGIIYLITNRVNGKKYVGQTVQELRTRWIQHKSNARGGSDKALHRAIRKYGPDSFTVEPIAESLEPFLSDLERMFIVLHCSFTEQYGYNLTTGGERNKTCSLETRAKLRAAVLGRRRSPDSVARQAATNRGSKRSPETCAKMCLAQKGRIVTPECRVKLAKAQTGKRHSAATIEKLKCRRHSDATRDKMRAAALARAARKE